VFTIRLIAVFIRSIRFFSLSLTKRLLTPRWRELAALSCPIIFSISPLFSAVVGVFTNNKTLQPLQVIVGENTNNGVKLAACAFSYQK
ncbi:MAG: hypothetical protein LPK07_08025, partial [Hymenobacteraceae bacterium]|nr:hypothetical protein [Hymenobacteraceae bacterium]MDX5481617.1 hypothetical protein [Hymenobacteraceae bacterium]